MKRMLSKQTTVTLIGWLLLEQTLITHLQLGECPHTDQIKPTWIGGSPAMVMSHTVTHGGFILAAALLVRVRLWGAFLLSTSALLLLMPSAQSSYAPVHVYNSSETAFKFIYPPTLSGLSSAGQSPRGCWIASLCPYGLSSLKHRNWSWQKWNTEVNNPFHTEEEYIILTAFTIYR